MGTSYLIVGDGIAGSSAAETLREHDPGSDVTVITDEGEALYNRILIKEFAKGKLPEAPISIHEPEWYAERDIELRLNTHVTRVNPGAHVVVTHDGTELSYDKLLIATGGTPTSLPVENADADGVHHFWTFEDARAIREHAEAAETGVVVGAGLLGIDLAAICGAQGVDAHYLMRGDRWWRYALSQSGAEIVHDALESIGVTPVFDSGVERFEVDDAGHVTGATDPNGAFYDGEFVGVAIGLDFNTEWLSGSGVECENGVIVDEYLRTGVDDIYAAGDITQFHDVIIGQRTQNGAWGSAKQQGATAATNMAADAPEEVFRWVPSYSITHFDFPFLSFGHPELGDDAAERSYAEGEWRRLKFVEGQLVGGVLIGDLSQQSTYKQLIREQRIVADQTDVLLEKSVDVEQLEPAPQAE